MVAGLGEAPGKVLLIGEHAVVYGHPAIAIPLRSVHARAEVEFARTPGIELDAPDVKEHVRPGDTASRRLAPLLKLARSVERLFGEQNQGLRIVVRSEIPVGRGMGSGAAVSVAIVRAVCNALDRRLNTEQISELALVAEKEYHRTPSGVDTAVVARDEPIYFVKDKAPRAIAVGPSVFHFLVADTGVSSSTAEVVDAVRAAREKDKANYDSYFWEIGSLASVSREILKNGSPVELGLCMSRAHQTLQSMGVSCRELDHLVSVALDNGAPGAKLSGAGRGGAMIALLPDAEHEQRITNELISAGAENVFSTVLASG